MIARLLHLLCEVHGVLEMRQLLIRNIDEDLIRRLKDRAAAHGRSAEAEHRIILQEAPCPGGASFAQRAARWRRLTAGRETTDSAELIRADRDRDHRP
jgi:plasmid stability protein